jgi:site-specific recombinase XerD
MNQFSAPYQHWLQSHQYSSATIKNYLVDLNKFLDFAKDDPFSVDTITRFIGSLNRDSNKNRYTSSLSKFLQFAVNQKLIDANPITKIKKQQNITPSVELDQLLSQYQSYLSKKHFSPSTIKNYLNDIQQFIDWTESKA